MRRSTRVVTATAHANAATLKTARGSRGAKREASTAVASASPLLVKDTTTKKARKPTDVVKSEPVLCRNENDSQLNIKQEQRVSVAVSAEDVSVSFVVKSEPHADISGSSSWHHLCSAQELSCKLTLASGQVFSWKFHAHTQEWSGVVGESVFVLREREPCVEFRCLHPTDLPEERGHEILSHYFRLEMDAAPLYALWTKQDDKMAQLIRSLPGHRLVRQDPVECLFAFICSSNNNIQRIQQMVDKLRATYGTLLCTTGTTDGTESIATANTLSYYSFPTTETLAEKCEEATLRALGFGYRAPFLCKSSQQLLALGGAEYLYRIRDDGTADSKDDSSHQEQLMVFTGVGRKVADCVALFSLEKLDAIPVDTHVWQIACREFDPSLTDKKSITPSVYRDVGDHFRKRFAPYAGWAHSVLFTGDLATFQSHLPTAMQKKKSVKAKVTKTKMKTVSTETEAKASAATGSGEGTSEAKPRVKKAKKTVVETKLNATLKKKEKAQ